MKERGWRGRLSVHERVIVVPQPHTSGEVAPSLLRNLLLLVLLSDLAQQLSSEAEAGAFTAAPLGPF